MRLDGGLQRAWNGARDLPTRRARVAVDDREGVIHQVKRDAIDGRLRRRRDVAGRRDDGCGGSEDDHGRSVNEEVRYARLNGIDDDELATVRLDRFDEEADAAPEG